MTRLSRFDLPPMPPLDAERVERHAAAQTRFARRLEETGDDVHRAFRYVQLRVLIDAAASIEPTVPSGEPELLPVRRRFVAPSYVERQLGVSRALRYIDERLTMVRHGYTNDVILPETPMVLHAYVEGADPEGRHTNAGMVRATQTYFAKGDIPYMPPPAEHCRRLLDEALQMANTAPAPVLTRAMWLMATVFAVHPFVDGNGRTGRLLMHALLAADGPVPNDWGTIPEFVAFRREYLEATRRPLRPSLPDYDATKLEPIHLMRWAADAAIGGLERVRRRLDHVDELVARLTSAYGPVGGLVVFGVLADRNARLDELAKLVPEPDLTRAVNELVAAGALGWDRYGHLQVTRSTP